jgi:hypothetical protein
MISIIFNTESRAEKCTLRLSLNLLDNIHSGIKFRDIPKNIKNNLKGVFSGNLVTCSE